VCRAGRASQPASLASGTGVARVAGRRVVREAVPGAAARRLPTCTTPHSPHSPQRRDNGGETPSGAARRQADVLLSRGKRWRSLPSHALLATEPLIPTRDSAGSRAEPVGRAACLAARPRRPARQPYYVSALVSKRDPLPAAPERPLRKNCLHGLIRHSKLPT